VTTRRFALPALWETHRHEWCPQTAVAGGLFAAAWAGCAVSWLGTSASGVRASSAWWCMPDMAPSRGGHASLYSVLHHELPTYLLMIVAMTLAGVLPAAQYVAVNSFRRKRSALLCAFFAIYLLVWLAFGTSMLSAIATAHLGPGPDALALALILAASYELAPFKRWALNRCHRTARLPPSGMRGALAVGRFGWVNTSGCVASCWASMIAMFLAGAVQPLVMVGTSAAMTYGRMARQPDRARRRIAAAYLVAAMVALSVGV
jgi:predicted metal-binding membrane protein